VLGLKTSCWRCKLNRIGLKGAAIKASKMLLRTPKPTEILWMNFAVTYLCNSRCKMCRIWSKYRQDLTLLKSELSLSEIENLLASRYLQTLQGIGFTGGEPLLRRDFVDLAGLFIERYPDAFIGIATNGLSPRLTVRKTREIVDRYHPSLLSLSISLDGIGSNHDRMRGVNGAYNRVLQTVQLLQEQTAVNLGFDFTITPWNYQDLWSTYKLSKELGVKFLAGFAHHSDSYYGNVDVAFDWQGGMREATSMVEKVAGDRAATENLLDKLIDPYACFMARAPEYELARSPMFKCYSGVHSLFLDPYGDVYPCIILDKKLGNVRSEPFDQLWLSSRAVNIRNHIGQGQCHCWVACEAVPSLLRGFNVPTWNLMNKILRPMVSRLNQHG
jgi:MoaA/NifB/PqqE/SkfB family radical SAM enzyme